MFVKEHWKVLKRDFLYKFFCPRLDLVVFIIMKQVVPHNERKFNQIFMVKREKADWRFKKEWKELSTQVNSNNIYLTDTNNWICRCLAYPISHFLFANILYNRKE